MIKAIIFDCFGVLTTDGWQVFKHSHFDRKSEQFRRATELNHMVDTGLISYEDFVHEIAQMAGVSDQEFDRVCKSVLPNKPLLEIIPTLKSRYKIGMLSNVSGDWLDKMFTSEERALFDATALSYEMGVIKPDPRAYEIIAERLAVSPRQCVFIDDHDTYVAAAEAQGMAGIHYRDLSDALVGFRNQGVELDK